MAQIKAFRQLYVKDRPKAVKILSTGNQFHGATPNQIQLRAVAEGIVVSKYEWFFDNDEETVRGTSQNFMVANNQVSVVLNVKVVVTATNNVTYEDVLSISKVMDGESVISKIPVQREWTQGIVYYNNDVQVDYIYHRATDSWWRLKDGFNEVTAGVNPGSQFVQLNSVEEMAVNILIAENANIAGFIFKDGKMVSQTPSTTNPNLTLDGVNGILKALSGQIGEFDINTGLEYDKEGNRLTSSGLKPYRHKFSIDKEGFNFSRDDWYDGNFCFEDNGMPFCASGNNHNLKYEVSTGGVDYYLKIKGEGKFRGSTYKGALWVDAVASTIPAILLGKGGLEVENGYIRILTAPYDWSTGRDLAMYAVNGDICVENGTFVANGSSGITGTYTFGSRTVTIQKGIITKVV